MEDHMLDTVLTSDDYVSQYMSSEHIVFPNDISGEILGDIVVQSLSAPLPMFDDKIPDEEYPLNTVVDPKSIAVDASPISQSPASGQIYDPRHNLEDVIPCITVQEYEDLIHRLRKEAYKHAINAINTKNTRAQIITGLETKTGVRLTENNYHQTIQIFEIMLPHYTLVFRQQRKFGKSPLFCLNLRDEKSECAVTLAQQFKTLMMHENTSSNISTPTLIERAKEYFEPIISRTRYSIEKYLYIIPSMDTSKLTPILSEHCRYRCNTFASSCQCYCWCFNSFFSRFVGHVQAIDRIITGHKIFLISANSITQELRNSNIQTITVSHFERGFVLNFNKNTKTISFYITRNDPYAPKQLIDEIFQLFPDAYAFESFFKPLDENELSIRVAEPTLRKTCFIFISLAIHVSGNIKTIEENYHRMISSVIFPYETKQGMFGIHFDEMFDKTIHQEKQMKEISQPPNKENRSKKRKRSSKTQHVNRFKPTSFDLRPTALAPIPVNSLVQIPLSVSQQQQTKPLNIPKANRTKFLIGHVEHTLKLKQKKCIKWREIFGNYEDKFVNMDVETNMITAFMENNKNNKMAMSFEFVIVPHGSLNDLESYIQLNSVKSLNELTLENWKTLILEDYVWVWTCGQGTSTRNYLDDIGQEFSKMFFPGSCLTVTSEDKLDKLYWRETLEQLLYVCDPASFEVKESRITNAGKGLYAKVDLPRGSLLRIEGTIAHANPNENEDFGPNTFNISYIDESTDDLVTEILVCNSDTESTKRCLSSFINDSMSEYNTKLELFLGSTTLSQDRFIKITEQIHAGDELYLNYGKLYWKMSDVKPNVLAHPSR